jgi:hypothetical protein
MASERKRFWSKVNKLKPRECWEWQGSRNTDGYGIFLQEKGVKQVRAHRVAWEFHMGPIPEGMCILHNCDNRACCNPNHLFLGSKKLNMEDAKGKERHAHGEKHGRSVLTDDEVIEIRAMYFNGRSLESIKSRMRLPVCLSTIERVAIGKRWSHLPGAVTCEERMFAVGARD